MLTRSMASSGSDLAELDEVASAIDGACRSGGHFEIQQALEQALPSIYPGAMQDPSASEAARAAATAFGYKMREVVDGHRRRLNVEPTMRDSHGQDVPPLLDKVPEAIVELWAGLADRVTEPAGRARLEHLLFAARHGNARDHAQRGARAYLDAASQLSGSLDEVDDLAYALRLSRAVADADWANEVMSRMAAAAEQELDRSADAPGITLGLLGRLVDEPDPPGTIDTLLDRSYETYRSVFIRDEVLALKERRADDAGRERIVESRVQLWLDAAAATDGIVRSKHTQTALELAEASGRSDLIQRAAAALQAIPKDELGLVSHSVSMALGQATFEKMLQPLTQPTSWQDTLTAFGRYGPVTGSIERNREAVVDLIRAAPVANLLPRTLLGGDGLPLYTAATDDEKFEVVLSEQEVQAIQTWGPLQAEALTRLVVRFGVPDQQELSEFFARRPHVTQEVAEAIARCFHRFWTGDYEGCTFTVIPRVEAVARAVVVATGVGVYRLQREQRPGQYPGLGVLLDALRKGGMDESWYRFLFTLCVNPAGWNIRNELSHGFINDVGPAVAAVLLHAITFITSLSVESPGVATAESG